MARTNKASKWETFYQIRLTRSPEDLWSWAIWEWDKRKGFNMRHLPGGGWLRTAKEAFDLATRWCEQNGIKTS